MMELGNDLPNLAGHSRLAIINFKRRDGIYLPGFDRPRFDITRLKRNSDGLILCRFRDSGIIRIKLENVVIVIKDLNPHPFGGVRSASNTKNVTAGYPRRP